jgi:hypothetical protein
MQAWACFTLEAGVGPATYVPAGRMSIGMDYMVLL